MSVLQSINTKQVLYKFKGRTYEEPPSKHFTILHEYLDGDIKYIVVKKDLPLFIHITFITILVILIGAVNAYCSVGLSNVFNHVMRVPSEMFYDSRSKTIDVDLYNDSSNAEIISITLKEHGKDAILTLNGIEPGHSIGAIPTSYEFVSLPSECILTYDVMFETGLVTSKDIKVLIVDRAIADKDENRDF